MAVINRKAGYLFLSEPHCASRAVSHALLQHRGSEAVGQHDSFDHLVARGRIQPDEKLLIFSVVRDPRSWLVTRYHHLNSWHKRGFSAFLDYQLDNDLLKNVMFTHGPVCNRIVRYETLNDDLAKLMAKFSLTVGDLPVIGKTPNKQPWYEYFQGDDINKLREYMKGRPCYGYVI